MTTRTHTDRPNRMRGNTVQQLLEEGCVLAGKKGGKGRVLFSANGEPIGTISSKMNPTLQHITDIRISKTRSVPMKATTLFTPSKTLINGVKDYFLTEPRRLRISGEKLDEYQKEMITIVTQILVKAERDLTLKEILSILTRDYADNPAINQMYAGIGQDSAYKRLSADLKESNLKRRKDGVYFA